MSKLPEFLASLMIAAITAGTVAYADGPTWAWLGFGLTVYLLLVNTPGGRRHL